MNESYGDFPDHPLHDVPQAVIDAARNQMQEMVEYESGPTGKLPWPADLSEIHAAADSILMSVWVTLKELQGEVA